MNSNNEKPQSEKSTLTNKKNWIEPKICTWESDNIENAGGGVLDGGLQTYV